MIKFYYNLAPNPTKVALCLEEMGLPLRTRSDRYAQGRAAQTGLPRHQSKCEVACHNR